MNRGLSHIFDFLWIIIMIKKNKILKYETNLIHQCFGRHCFTRHATSVYVACWFLKGHVNWRNIIRYTKCGLIWQWAHPPLYYLFRYHWRCVNQGGNHINAGKCILFTEGVLNSQLKYWTSKEDQVSWLSTVFIVPEICDHYTCRYPGFYWRCWYISSVDI